MSDSELVFLVDENDNILGQKKRGELVDEDCWRLASVWVENSKGQVLLQQRSFSKSLSPGRWTPAADGTVTAGHDYKETAVRELEEEIGLNGVILKPQNKVCARFDFGSRMWHGFTTMCDWPIENFTLQESEVEKLEWVDKAQLLNELRGNTPPSREYPGSSKYWIELFNL